MKSTDYSAKSAFPAAFKTVFRRQLPSALILAVICCLVSAAFALYSITDYSYAEYDITYEVQFWGITVFSVLFWYCAISVAVMYKGLFSRRACDYHLSLPMKRENIFNSNFLFGILSVLFAILVSVGTFAAVHKSYSSIVAPDVVYTVDIKTVTVQFFCVFAALLAIYSAFHMCASASGKWIQYGMFCVICAVSAPVLFAGIAVQINSIWGFSVDAFDFASVTPFGAVAKMFVVSENSDYLFMTIVSVVEFIAMYFAGLLSFKHRKAEIAESGQGGSAVKYVLMAVFVGAGYMYFGSGESFIASVILGLIAALVCAAMFAPVHVHSKKLFNKKTGAVFGVTAGICLIITCCAYFINTTSYVRYVPKIDEVESVTVTEYDPWSQYGTDSFLDLTTFIWGIPQEYDVATLTQEQDIQKVIDFHTDAVSDRVMGYGFSDYLSETVSELADSVSEENAAANSDGEVAAQIQETTTLDDTYETEYGEEQFDGMPINCKIEYKLKDGSIVKRSYSIQYDLWEEFVAIFQNEEAIMQTEPYSLEEDDIMFIEANVYSTEVSEEDADYTYGTDDYYVFVPEMWGELRDLAVQDKLNEAYYDFYFEFYDSGYISVYTLNEDLPQEQKEKILNMTPFERYEYSNQVNNLMYDESGEYEEYPFTSYDVPIILSDENLLNYMSQPEMQRYIVE